MQAPISSSVCVRLTHKCRDSVQLVLKNSSNKNQIRLINRNSNDFSSYEFDQIYDKQSKNQDLYQSLIFPKSSQSLLDVQSGLFCFIGSQGGGKTYTAIGQLNNVLLKSGLLVYLMHDAYLNSIQLNNQNKPSSSNNNTVQLKFLQILGDNVQNIGFQTVYGQSNKERQLGNRIDYTIDIKNMAHFESCINKIYQRKKPHTHLVIQVTIKSAPLIYTTKKKTTITFIEISSACFDEANVHAQKIKSQVEALITLFQNISRIKHLEHLFQSTKFTKLLKNNFLQARKITLIGILDNSYKGNTMTLKWLKTALQQRQDKTIIEGMKQDIKKEQDSLKSFMQKHRKAMALLSKCIGTELGFLQKQKCLSTSKRQIQFSLGNNSKKGVDKIKIANIRKQENQKSIQDLNRFICVQQQEINKLESKYGQDLRRLQEERSQITWVKNKLVSKMQQTTQQLMYKHVHSTTNNSLFWRPQIDFDQTPSHFLNQSKKSLSKEFTSSTLKKDMSQNTLLKNSSKKIINGSQPSLTNGTLSDKLQRKKIAYQSDQQNLLLQIERQKSILNGQTKREVYQIFKLISQQQKQFQTIIKQNNPQVSTRLINKIKNRQQNKIMGQINNRMVIKLLKQGKQFQLGSYLQFFNSYKVCMNFSKDLS